jgi:hypothetical protein
MQQGERWTAAMAGLSKYNTGKPCNKGHLSDRYTASGGCVECIKGYAKLYNKKLNDTKPTSDNFDTKTELVFIVVHVNDMPTIKAVLDSFVTGFHPDSVNPYPFKKVKYFGDGSVARVQVRIPHGKFEEINNLANSLRTLAAEPIKSPDFSVLPVAPKRELPNDFENI